MRNQKSLPLSGVDVAILVGGLGTRLRGGGGIMCRSRSLRYALQRLHGRFCPRKNALCPVDEIVFDSRMGSHNLKP